MNQIHHLAPAARSPGARPTTHGGALPGRACDRRRCTFYRRPVCANHADRRALVMAPDHVTSLCGPCGLAAHAEGSADDAEGSARRILMFGFWLQLAAAATPGEPVDWRHVTWRLHDTATMRALRQQSGP